MIIRQPKESDIDKLINLSQEYAKENDWAGDIPIGKIDNKKKARERLFGENVYKALIAEDKGKLAGYIGVKKYDGGYEASILIQSDYRNIGLGKKLTDSIVELIPREIEVGAWVAEFNALSLKVTPKLGFEFEKKFIDTEHIPDKDFYVYVFKKRW
jgi:L-amino acid N-acyltransferase YncA